MKERLMRPGGNYRINRKVTKKAQRIYFMMRKKQEELDNEYRQAVMRND